MRRLILFLQQSSVEWASSLWMHVVQELDPEFKRTARALPLHLPMPVTASDCDHTINVTGSCSLPLHLSMPVTASDCDQTITVNGSCAFTDCWQACERSDEFDDFSIMVCWCALVECGACCADRGGEQV